MDKVVALLCVGCLGTCFSLLGAISVKLMPRLGIDKGGFGTLISIFMSVCLAVSLVAGMVLDSVGFGPVAMAGFGLTACALLLWSRAATFPMAIVACVVLGFGAMALNTAGNTLIPEVLFGGKNPAAASNLGNVFFGLGLLLTPLSASWLFRRTTYERALLVLGVALLLPLPLAMLATYPSSHASLDFSRVAGLLGDAVVPVAGLVLFCYFGMEASFAHWLPTLGKEVIGRDRPELEGRVVDGLAQRLLSWFALGMMAGRFTVSQIPVITRYGPWFIAGAAVVAAAVVLAITVARGTVQVRSLSIGSGLVFGLVFPTTIGVTFAHFPKDIRGTVFGIIFAIGLAGCVIVPKAIGNVARRTSVQHGMRLLLPLCIALFVLAVAFGWIR